MIKNLSIILFFSFALNFAMADDCFQYNALGEIKRVEQGLVLIVNAKSASEYSIAIAESEWPVVVPYVDKNLNIEFISKEKMKGYKGLANKVTKVDSTIIDPLKDSLENRLFLQGPVKCQ